MSRHSGSDGIHSVHTKGSSLPSLGVKSVDFVDLKHPVPCLFSLFLRDETDSEISPRTRERLIRIGTRGERQELLRSDSFYDDLI